MLVYTYPFLLIALAVLVSVPVAWLIYFAYGRHQAAG